MTNTDRAERIALILTGMEDETPETVLIDLLADCLHWCHQNAQSFNDLLEIATGHFESELAQERKANNPIFRLTCAHCDAATAVANELAANAQGWSRVQPFERVEETHLGVCPHCQQVEV